MISWFHVAQVSRSQIGVRRDNRTFFLFIRNGFSIEPRPPGSEEERGGGAMRLLGRAQTRRIVRLSLSLSQLWIINENKLECAIRSAGGRQSEATMQVENVCVCVGEKERERDKLNRNDRRASLANQRGSSETNLQDLSIADDSFSSRGSCAHLSARLSRSTAVSSRDNAGNSECKPR